MKLEAMAVTLPEVAGHPNRAPFTGVLTLVDEPSTKPPSGARGHRVILTRGASAESSRRPTWRARVSGWPAIFSRRIFPR